MTDLQTEVLDTARRAKKAAADLAQRPRGAKDAALHAMADALLARSAEIVEANARDTERARAAGSQAGYIDRLTLTEARVAAIADALRQLAFLPDPVGETVRGNVLPNGIELRQVRGPLGVVGIIYEARPNVTVDAAGLCLEAGNAPLLRRASFAQESTTGMGAVTLGAAGAAGVAAAEQDFAAEYESLDLSAAVVDSLDEAIEHVNTYNTGHTDVIVTRDLAAARAFQLRVDAAAVGVNVSTRFTDGGEFGFGAEIGISTQKTHARGPMGLPELTSTKYLMVGDGQIRE